MLPTEIETFVNPDMSAWALAWQEFHGFSPSASDCAHVAWRRIRENMTFADMIASVRDPDLSWPMKANPITGVITEHDSFVDALVALSVVRHDAGGDWWPALMGRWAVRLLLEDARYDDLLKDARDRA